MPPHSCLTMFPEHYFLVHPSVFPQASECPPSGHPAMPGQTLSSSSVVRCHPPKTREGGVLCPSEKGCQPLPSTALGGVTCTASAVCTAGAVVTTAPALHPPPPHDLHGAHTGDPPPPAVAALPCSAVPCAPPPAPVCTTGQGVGTPPVPSLYSVPLHRLWRRRCAAACGGAPPGVSTPPHAAQVAPPTAVCAHMCILKQVQKGLKKQPFS